MKKITLTFDITMSTVMDHVLSDLEKQIKIEQKQKGSGLFADFYISGLAEIAEMRKQIKTQTTWKD